MEQIVERKDKSVAKTFLVVIGFVVFIDFIIFIMNKYTEVFPYATSLITIFLVIISCSYILIKYLSKYLYTIEANQLIFYRLIGKRKFEMLRIDCSNLIYIDLYDAKNNYEKHLYNFTFDKSGEKLYIGKFKEGDKMISFLFSPNKDILNELKKFKN